MTEKAYFATGCFWGAERKFWQTPGVLATSVGYMGGDVTNPTYEWVCDGSTGHAETVELTFDPKQVSYTQLLELFWAMHDPTSLNRQGNDRGSQYASAIFTTTPQQHEQALATQAIYQAALTKAGHGKIVTLIEQAANHPYWPAEGYHQRYLAKNPNGYDCHSSTGVPFPH